MKNQESYASVGTELLSTLKLLYTALDPNEVLVGWRIWFRSYYMKHLSCKFVPHAA